MPIWQFVRGSQPLTTARFVWDSDVRLRIILVPRMDSEWKDGNKVGSDQWTFQICAGDEHLSLETSAFCTGDEQFSAKDECISHWEQTHFALETSSFDAGDEHVENTYFKFQQLHVATSNFQMEFMLRWLLLTAIYLRNSHCYAVEIQKYLDTQQASSVVLKHKVGVLRYILILWLRSLIFIFGAWRTKIMEVWPDETSPLYSSQT